jgi:hypothetical protein
MKALVLRDFDLQKSMIAFWSCYSLFFFLPALVFADWRPSLAFAVTLVSIVVGLLAVVSGSKAEPSSPELLVASFPVNRRQIADAKFLWMFLAAAFGFATSLAWGLFLRLIGLQIEFEGFGWLVPIRILAGLGLLSWLVALYMRLGPDFMRVVMVASLTVMVLLQIGLMVLVGGRSSNLSRVIRTVLAWYADLPLTGRNLALLGLGLLVGTSSWLATRRIIERKEY